MTHNLNPAGQWSHGEAKPEKCGLLTSFLDPLSLTKWILAIRMLATGAFQYDLGAYHVTCTEPSWLNSSKVTRTVKASQGAGRQGPDSHKTCVWHCPCTWSHD